MIVDKFENAIFLCYQLVFGKRSKIIIKCNFNQSAEHFRLTCVEPKLIFE